MPPLIPPIDAIVAGTGPAGLAVALALAGEGLRVRVIGPPVSIDRAERDRRTTALFGGSIELLRHLGVWHELAPHASPLESLRLVDDTPGPFRAPELLFRSDEIGKTAFGYNFENTALLLALWRRAREMPGLELVAGLTTYVAPRTDCVEAHCEDGLVLTAKLLVGADGRQSICRAGARIDTKVWSYPQSALVTTFTHSRPHRNTSTEFHRRAGPLTTVPLAGNRSSLVWVETAAEAERLLGLGSDAFRDALTERLQGLLGTIGALGSRAAFPLSGLIAEPMAQSRVALVGEAGHVMPPIGAQGLNLGFRDAAWLAEIAGQARREGDPGSEAALARYAAARAWDVRSREMAVDLVNRSLLLGHLGPDLLRAACVTALAGLPWLKRLVMRQGIGPGGPQPRLLKP